MGTSSLVCRLYIICRRKGNINVWKQGTYVDRVGIAIRCPWHTSLASVSCLVASPSEPEQAAVEWVQLRR